ncbi:MAG: SDR family oxidoreductase [Burkholderiaceae bacterium]
MDLGIAGKWALVCGASKGLGLGCAQALHAEGVNVVLVARGVEVLQQSAINLIAVQAINTPAMDQFEGKNQLNQQTQPKVLFVAADITTDAGRHAAFSVAGGPGKDFDIVITNAGGPPPGDFRNWEREDWLKAVDANMLTPIELIKATIDGMAARGFGRVVNITSSSVKAPIEILGLSNGARSGLTGFVAGIARNSNLVANNVTINNLLPGTFDTDRIKTTLQGQATKTGQSLEEVRETRRKTIPAKRFGNPAEFGATCAFLCSQQASYITGQNILTDGGAYSGTY